MWAELPERIMGRSYSSGIVKSQDITHIITHLQIRNGFGYPYDTEMKLTKFGAGDENTQGSTHVRVDLEYRMVFWQPMSFQNIRTSIKIC